MYTGSVSFTNLLSLRPADTSEGIRSRRTIVAKDIAQALIFIVMVMRGNIDTGKDFHTLFGIIVQVHSSGPGTWESGTQAVALYWHGNTLL